MSTLDARGDPDGGLSLSGERLRRRATLGVLGGDLRLTGDLDLEVDEGGEGEGALSTESTELLLEEETHVWPRSLDTCGSVTLSAFST